MLCSTARATIQQLRPAAPQARRSSAPRRVVVAASPKQTVWNGEGPDYTMKDVENFHDEAAKAERRAGVFNGEGPDFDMRDVEALHDAVAKAKARGPDPSQYNGEGPDFTMKDVEAFHEEAAKDRAVRRK